VALFAPSPIALYTSGRVTLRIRPQPIPSTIAARYSTGIAHASTWSGATPSRVAKLSSARNTMTARHTVAIAGATIRRQAVSPDGCRTKNTMTATDVAAISSRTPSAPDVPPQKNNWTSGSQPATA
jgi:hypothetical protein